ncbi:MAG: 3-deoxy-D-manno-octulosonic acid kinase [Gammaproteobacteria bacterium]|nr:3-deoxy-D-manno-octulosonic acid kinase [Gammaproteobacteria bacterium]
MPNIAPLSKNNWLITCSGAPEEITAEWFTPEFWMNHEWITGSSFGRNKTYFCQYPKNDNGYLELVLRHYFRGGLVGKINNDAYHFSSIESTRPYRELSILESIQNKQLPGPKPIGGYVIKHRGFYRADILIEKIPDAKDAYQILIEQEVSESTWIKMGQCIRNFHDAGIFHADLNIHNIMLNEDGDTWLIDFDKGEERAPSKKWQSVNLERLLRSLNKEKAKHPEFNFAAERWQWLLNGYYG